MCGNANEEKKREAKPTGERQLCMSDMTIAGVREDDITNRAKRIKKVTCCTVEPR